MSALERHIARRLQGAERERDSKAQVRTQVRKPKPRAVKTFTLNPQELADRYGIEVTPVRSREQLLAQSTSDSYLGLGRLHPNLGWENDNGKSRKPNTRRYRVTQVTTGRVRLDRTTARRGEVQQARKILGYG